MILGNSRTSCKPSILKQSFLVSGRWVPVQHGVDDRGNLLPKVISEAELSYQHEKLRRRELQQHPTLLNEIKDAKRFSHPERIQNPKRHIKDLNGSRYHNLTRDEEAGNCPVVFVLRSRIAPGLNPEEGEFDRDYGWAPAYVIFKSQRHLSRKLGPGLASLHRMTVVEISYPIRHFFEKRLFSEYPEEVQS
jgi:hypothetical protein